MTRKIYLLTILVSASCPWIAARAGTMSIGKDTLTVYYRSVPGNVATFSYGSGFYPAVGESGPYLMTGRLEIRNNTNIAVTAGLCAAGTYGYCGQEPIGTIEIWNGTWQYPLGTAMHMSLYAPGLSPAPEPFLQYETLTIPAQGMATVTVRSWGTIAVPNPLTHVGATKGLGVTIMIPSRNSFIGTMGTVLFVYGPNLPSAETCSLSTHGLSWDLGTIGLGGLAIGDETTTVYKNFTFNCPAGSKVSSTTLALNGPVVPNEPTGIISTERATGLVAEIVYNNAPLPVSTPITVNNVAVGGDTQISLGARLKRTGAIEPGNYHFVATLTMTYQ